MITSDQEAQQKALAAIAGEYGAEEPSISRVSWLHTLLREIDDTPGVKDLLERDDGSAMLTMLRECRELADEGMAALQLLRPKFPFEIVEQPAAAGADEIGF